MPTGAHSNAASRGPADSGASLGNTSFFSLIFLPLLLALSFCSFARMQLYTHARQLAHLRWVRTSNLSSRMSLEFISLLPRFRGGGEYLRLPMLRLSQVKMSLPIGQ